MRVNITLACTECGDRNYISKKINVTIQTVLSLKILLKRKRSTTHRETK
ncbi:50S ribosomal protein L33 [[Brevibacterium] frigoritolerans]|uniref:Large ribosomal subunit protein bL33 n=1 Tax=Peribacillus frigoritolerans TaxID=450367 RepID=A0A941FRE5_9BACI|nr:50S ribosomal protein L33 [Peribacillus frigoritolerans]